MYECKTFISRINCVQCIFNRLAHIKLGFMKITCISTYGRNYLLTKMSLDEVFVDEVSVDEISSGRKCLDEFSVDDFSAPRRRELLIEKSHF